MEISALSDKERKIIYECMKAALNGFFLPEWEFSTLIGVNRQKVEDIMSDWPTMHKFSQDVQVVVTNIMVNLIGYPHGKTHEWNQYISASPKEVSKIIGKLKKYEEDPIVGE